jgi:predicted outer membrane protein
MPLVQRLGVTPVTQLDARRQKIADKLSKLQGQDFDKQFMKTMVDAHEDVASQTQKVAKRGGTSSGMSASSATSGGSAAGTTGAATGTTGSTTAATAGTSGAAGSPGGAASAVTPTTTLEYATVTLPIVQHHLQQARQLEKTVDK